MAALRPGPPARLQRGRHALLAGACRAPASSRCCGPSPAWRGSPLDDWWQVLGWTTLAVLAAGFPIQIPRSKHSIATGDIVIFLLLALHGAAAATVAAALGVVHRVAPHDACASAATSPAPPPAPPRWRSPARCSSSRKPGSRRTACRTRQRTWRRSALAALVHFSVSTMALMQVIYLKRGQRLSLRRLARQHQLGRHAVPDLVGAGRRAVAQRAAVRPLGRGGRCAGDRPVAGAAARALPPADRRTRGAGGARRRRRTRGGAEPEALPRRLHARLDRHGHRVAGRQGAAGQPGAVRAGRPHREGAARPHLPRPAASGRRGAAPAPCRLAGRAARRGVLDRAALPRRRRTARPGSRCTARRTTTRAMPAPA